MSGGSLDYVSIAEFSDLVCGRASSEGLRRAEEELRTHGAADVAGELAEVLKWTSVLADEASPLGVRWSKVRSVLKDLEWWLSGDRTESAFLASLQEYRDVAAPWAEHKFTETEVETFSGLAVDLVDPDPVTISLVDVATHLSRIDRFLGATSVPISVAAHSLLVVDVISALCHRGPEPMVPERNVLAAALLHDAPEAYLCDVPRPLKKLLGERYAELEEKMTAAVARRFGIRWSERIRTEVRRADDYALSVEARLMVSRGRGWGSVSPVTDDDIRPVVFETSDAARGAFLARADQLGIR